MYKTLRTVLVPEIILNTAELSWDAVEPDGTGSGTRLSPALPFTCGCGQVLFY